MTIVAFVSINVKFLQTGCALMGLNTSFSFTRCAFRILSILLILVFDLLPLSNFVAEGTIILINVCLYHSIFRIVVALLFSLHLGKQHFVYNFLVETTAALSVIFVSQVNLVDLLITAKTSDTWFYCFEYRTVIALTLFYHLEIQTYIFEIIILVVKLYATLIICYLSSLRKCFPVCFFLAYVAVGLRIA